jgi:hypothetical protein
LYSQNLVVILIVHRNGILCRLGLGHKQESAHLMELLLLREKAEPLERHVQMRGA